MVTPIGAGALSSLGSGTLNLRKGGAWKPVGGASGVWVVAGDSGSMWTSTDLSTWSSVDAGFGTNRIRQVKYLGGQFIAVGQAGKIATSPDGTTWTQQTSGTTVELLTVGWSGTEYLAGGGNICRVSSDGVTWTSRGGFDLNPIYEITHANGTWAIAGRSGTQAHVVRSTNGTSWTTSVPWTDTTQAGVKSIDFGNGEWAIAGFRGTSGARSCKSTDLNTWTIITTGTSAPGGQVKTALTYANGLWIFGGLNGGLVTSADLVSFTSRTSQFGTDVVASALYANGTWLIVGSGGKTSTSTDGATWAAVAGSPFGTTELFSAAFGEPA